MRNGIAIGGSIFVDYLKQIDFYPREGMLTPIRAQSMSIGGCVGNTGISLKRLSPSLDVRAIGCVGKDPAGEYVRDTYRKNDLNVDGIITIDAEPTGFTDVYASVKSNTRSFFVQIGANTLFDYAHIDYDSLDSKILHMGYILLLERMDSPDDEYGTIMARALHEAQKRGIKTSIDVVSEDSDRFRILVPPSLKYCDYAILNEIEAGRTVGVEPRDKSGALIWESLPVICEKLIELGVREHVIIHCPETGIMMDSGKKWVGMRSLRLPEGFIQGSVGSGDAFCAGTLIGLHNGLSPEETLRIANSAAAGCLSSADGTSGVCTIENMLDLHKLYSDPNEHFTTC